MSAGDLLRTHDRELENANTAIGVLRAENQRLLEQLQAYERVAAAARHLLRDNEPADLADRADPLRYALRDLESNPAMRQDDV